MKLAVPTETRPGERRVALVPDVVKKLVGAGWEVCVQSGAGTEAAFTDAAYTEAGATVAPDAAATLAGAGLVVRVNAPSSEEVAALPQGVTILSFFGVAQSQDAVRALAARGTTVFSFDLLPRISRAQGMDALSSQATVSGYRSGLAAAEHLAKFFPMFMTAAGTVPPAKVLVMGVGVAGLQSIATARRLGAVVKAYDVRAAAKEEAESLGATFLDTGVSAEGTGGYAASSPPRSSTASAPRWPRRSAAPTSSSPRQPCRAARRRCCSRPPWSRAWRWGRWWSTWPPTRAATAS